MLLLLLALQEPSAEAVEAVRAALKGDAAALKKVEGAPLAAVEKAVRLAMRPPAKDAGRSVTREVASDVDAGVTIRYHLAVPENLDEPRPLLLTLHGQGGDAGDWFRYRCEELKERGFFILAPQAGSAGWGHSRLGYSCALAPLRDVLANYPVDPDRIWVDGFSMGANGTWQIGSIFPDRFAALAPRGGAPHFVKVNRDGAVETKPLYARNLKALPVSWTVGAKDKGLPMDSVRALRGILSGWSYDVTYKELPEGGHEWFPEETARVMEWLATKRRAADPPEVRLSCWERTFARSYWVELLEFTAKESVKTPVKDLDGKLLETRQIFSTEVIVTAKADRKANRVDVRADGVKELRLWLNDRLVDLSKPVTVRINGKEAHKGKVESSVQKMLDEAKRRGDAGLLYPASITLTVP